MIAVSYFPDYAAIPEQSGIWTRLPVFFPSSASEIEMTFNPTAIFYADFSVADGDKRAHFESVLGRRAWFIMPTFLIKAGVKRENYLE